jgi:hypothetical protein
MTQKSHISPNVVKAFFKEFDKTKQEEQRKNQKFAKMSAEKSVTLTPVKDFLRTLSTLGVQMKDGRMFQFYERDSSPSWQPGVSLFFDYPAPVEIAIPNNTQKEGALVIRIAREDPDSIRLQQRFETIEEGLEVLASFLGKHTFQLEIDPRNREETREKINQKRLITSQLKEEKVFTDVPPIEVNDGN